MIATPVKHLDEMRVTLQGISWATYEAMLRELERQPGKRLTYDHGLLEIMSPSINHEKLKNLLGRVVALTAEELDIEIASLGSATWRRADLQRGFEADQCYYVQHESMVRGRETIDLAVDPPPDLIIEVDLSSTSINKFPLFAQLAIPEVWVYRGQAISFFVLRDGQYVQMTHSGAFPLLQAEALQNFLNVSTEVGEITWTRRFRQYLQKINQV